MVVSRWPLAVGRWPEQIRSVVSANCQLQIANCKLLIARSRERQFPDEPYLLDDEMLTDHGDGVTLTG